MKFKLLLRCTQPQNTIPLNYQYPLSAAIYKILNRADAAYAQFLHDTGYRKTDSLKSFKLFTFSDLNVPFKVLKGMHSKNLVKLFNIDAYEISNIN